MLRASRRGLSHEARGCRTPAGGLEGASGELLEASWKLASLLWRDLGSALEAPRAILEALGERAGGRPGDHWGGPGAPGGV